MLAPEENETQSPEAVMFSIPELYVNGSMAVKALRINHDLTRLESKLSKLKEHMCALISSLVEEEETEPKSSPIHEVVKILGQLDSIEDLAKIMQVKARNIMDEIPERHVVGRDENGRTALHCVETCRIAWVLLEMGVPIAARDNFGKTALHTVNHSEVLVALLSFIHDEPGILEIRDMNGHTALHQAAIDGDEKAIEYLINAGANIDATTDSGKRP